MALIETPVFRLVPLAEIDEPALPSRTEMDAQKLDELVASIRALGFISVVVLVAAGARFRVIAGHRRTIAARRAGLIELPAFVYSTESAALDAIQHAENRHREELSVTDEAIWFAQLLEAHPDEGTDGVAGRVGESRAYVEGRLLLLQGCDRVFAALAAHDINIGVAQQLNLVTEPAHRYMLLDQAIRGGATVSIARRWVQEWKTIYAPASGTPPPEAPIASPSAVVLDDYFVCRVCGERHNPHSMRPMNGHDYCWLTLIDPRTGLIRAKSEYVLFPRTRAAAAQLVEQLIERFPELLEPSAAPSESAPR